MSGFISKFHRHVLATGILGGALLFTCATGAEHPTDVRATDSAGEETISHNKSTAQRKLQELGITQDQYINALLAAAEEGQLERLILLVSAGTNPNCISHRYGCTPLILAAYNGHNECVRHLLAVPGIDVNKTQVFYNTTALIKAALNGHTECVRLLLAAPGINVNHVDINHRTALGSAAEHGHAECVRLLLSAPGIDVNQTRPPLILAAFYGNTECVKLLLTAPGIDVNKVDHGHTALYYAEKYNHKECARLIREAGGQK